MRPTAFAVAQSFVVASLLAGAGCGGGGGGGSDVAAVPLTATVVDAGGNHGLAIAQDGTVLAWGSNADGQLGDGTTTTRLTPAPVVGLGPGSDVIAVSGGGPFSLALKRDGTVLGWGANSLGSLGDGTTTSRLTPVTALGLGPGSGVIAIATGIAHSLALKSDGTLLAFGANVNGQIGDGTTVQKSSPVQIFPPGSGVIAIGASGTVSAALKADGTMLAWGSNNLGQLGDGTTTQRTSPVQVMGLGPGSGVVAIQTGANSMALKADGSLLAWGANGNGQVGDGTTTNRNVPVPVTGLGAGSGVVAIAGGTGAHSLALRSDGTVLAWGANGAGQLGDGTATNRSTPGAIPGLGDVASIDAGSAHSLVRKIDGTVLAFGSNGNGQLGDGTFQGSRTLVEPVGLGAGSEATAASGGSNHSLVLLSNGAVLAFGLNLNGQLGDGTTSSAFVPVPVSGFGPGSGIAAISAGSGGAFSGHSLAVRSDGAVFAWGLNINGQLGDGTTVQKTTPVQVTGLGPGSGVVAVAAGGLGFSLALKADGTVLAWGANLNGQLGDGSTTQRTTPVQVTGLGPGSGVIAIAANNHNLALKADGTVLAWGGNLSGAIGDGTMVQKTSPVQVTGLGPGSGVVAIETGGGYSLALKSDGSVLAWGANQNGQLGDGTFETRLTPVLVTVLGTRPVTALAADASSGAAPATTFVLTSDGAVLGFGSNATGQLGDGTFEARVAPVQVGDLGPGSGVTAIGSGTGFLLAVRTNGQVSAVGSDAFGQLGDGPNSTKGLTPQPVLVFIAR